MESHIKNQSPSAPASVAAKQTKDGMLITWSDAQDDHTPAMQMRYNISVKRKGKKGDNSFVISPMNGLKDKATICGTIMYKKSTQMLVPASVLTAGETYEIQVQAIDLWNQHSPMTKAIEFTMTSNGYIDVAEQVATDKETTVKFVGTQAGSYSLNAGDGATIVSDKGNGEEHYADSRQCNGEVICHSSKAYRPYIYSSCNGVCQGTADHRGKRRDG